MFEKTWEDLGDANIETELVVNPFARDLYTNHWVDAKYANPEFGSIRLHHREENGWNKWFYLLTSYCIEDIMIGLIKYEGVVFRCADGVFAVQKGKLKKVNVSKNLNLPLAECIDDSFVKKNLRIKE